MTRDGTVGRSDATERNLPLHRDFDPVRMMRTRFADPIRASSPSGLRQKAGHIYGRPHAVRGISKISSPSIGCLQSSIRSCSTLMGSAELHPNI